MRIGFFTDTYLPSESGVETSIESFRKCLEKRKHRVFIFAPHFPGYKDVNSRVFRFRSLKAIAKPELRFTFPFLPINGLGEVINLKLDVVHTHTPFSMGFLGRFIAYRQKIPIIYTHHAQYPEYAKVYIKEKILSPRLVRSLITYFSNICNAVIAPSFKMKCLLRNYGIKKPIYTLPTGINLEIFKRSLKGKKEFRKKMAVSPETKILLFVGRMGKEKNVEYLIKVFKEVLAMTKIPVTLWMVGSGPYLEKFRQLGNSLGISQFINFTGAISHKEIPSYYQAADIFLFTSLTDTQGIVILEAIASGLPVVALKDDAFKEFVIDNKNGFLIKRAFRHNFAQKIVELLEKPALYKKLSNASLQISQGFSERKQTQKLLNIYKKYL